MEPVAPSKSTVLIVFLALFACYLSLSPGIVSGMGYVGEEVQSGDRLITIVDAWRRSVPSPPMVWSRHGLLPVLFDIPFIAVGKLIATTDFLMSFQPVLLSAGLCTLLFLWFRKLISPGMSLLFTLTAAFGTMLWAYAYIGLETKQSFFVLLAGYLALAPQGPRTWRRTLLFAASCGLAISVKSTGVVLGPPILWLIYVYCQEDWRARRKEIATVLFVVGIILVTGAYFRMLFWQPLGGGLQKLKVWLIDSPIMFGVNWIGIFGSPNKGVFLYAPILLAGLYAIPRTFRAHRDTVVFALLLLGCIGMEIAMLPAPADELWGSRYLHSALAPLILCIGAAYPRFHWRSGGPLIALAAAGLVVSFLGAFYWYGALHVASIKTGQNTLEWLAGDTVWNPIRFHARLFQAWWHGGSGPVLWTPFHYWMYEPIPGTPPWKAVDLRELCQPQAFLVRYWGLPKRGLEMRMFYLYVLAVPAGLGLLAWAILRTIRGERYPARTAGPAHDARQRLQASTTRSTSSSRK